MSVAIMAHPARARFVADLVETLDCRPVVVWDRRNDRWDTGRRAMLAFDPGATHHLVVQDDAVVPRNLVEGLERALAVRPHTVVSLYTGKQRPNGPMFVRLVKAAKARRASWVVFPQLCWGVGVVVPTPLVRDMIAHGDGHPGVANYDSRLSLYLEARGIPTYYTVPSLVDHRPYDENPSLVPGRTGTGRVAHLFVGRNADARSIDWNPRVIVESTLRRRTVGVRCPVCGAENYACTPEPGKEVRPVDELVDAPKPPAGDNPMVVVDAIVNGNRTRLRMRRSEAIEQGLLVEEVEPATKKRPPAKNKARTGVMNKAAIGR